MHTDKHLLCCQMFQYNSFTGAKNIDKQTQAQRNMSRILMLQIAKTREKSPLYGISSREDPTDVARFVGKASASMRPHCNTEHCSF